MMRLSSIVAAIVVAWALGMPASAELVGWWNLDGNLADSGSLGRNGSFAGGTLTYTADRFGNPGAAVSFDGVDDVVDYAAGRPSNSFTMAAWVRVYNTHEIDIETTASTSGTSGQEYLFGAAHGGTNAGAGVSMGTNGISVYEHGSSYMPATAVYNPGNTTTIGTGWNHVAVVYDNKTPTIYLNGRKVRGGLTSPRPSVLSPVSFGGGPYGYIQADVDDVVIYNEALDFDRVYQLGSGYSPDKIHKRLVLNGSFEIDPVFTNFPGYSSGNMPISGWNTTNSSRTGLNPGSTFTPFADNGAIPDGQRVAFIQSNGGPTTLSQDLTGLEAGQHYLVTYRENARNGNVAKATVTLGGETVVATHNVAPVGGTNPYRYVGSSIHQAAGSTATLGFSNDTATDNTLLIDNVQVVPMQLLFADNYNVSTHTYNINTSPGDEPGRQTGAYAPLGYT